MRDKQPIPLWVTSDLGGVRVWDTYAGPPVIYGDYFIRGTGSTGSLGAFCRGGFARRTGIQLPHGAARRHKVFVVPFTTKREAQLALDLVARAKRRTPTAVKKLPKKKKPAGRSAGRRTRRK